jgi:GTP-binding protein
MDTNNELFLYNVNLIKKRQIVLITKKDTFLEEDKEARKNLDKLKKKIKNNKKCNVLNIFEISSLSREGLQEFLDYLYTFMKEIKDEKEEVFEDKKYSVKEYTLEPDFKIEKEDDVFYVRGKKIETLVSMTFFSEPESLMRFQNILNKMGIDKALIEYGVQKGDLVKIGHFEFYFER